MIELIFLIVTLLVLGCWALITVVTITIADIKSIDLERSLRAHPHARKWRGVTKLAKTVRPNAAGYTIPKKDIRLAQAYFQADASMRFVEILPRIEFPQTIMGLFSIYRLLALAPFVRVRQTLNVRPAHTMWPSLTKKKLMKNSYEKYYSLALTVLSSFNLALLIYVSYIALIAGQPDYLLGYMTIFGLWLAWSISNYSRLVWRQKIVYLFLVPMSFGYFLWRAFAAPFSLLQQLDIRPLIRRVLS